jgi:hypothetical protein
MAEHNETSEPNLGEQRRRFLRLAGSAAVLLPIAAITGCRNDDPPAPAPPTTPPPQTAEPEPVTEMAPDPEPAPEPAPEVATEDLPELDPNDPTARALGYQHHADDVDPERFPQRQADHLCSNCALYTGRDGDQWGPCGLFPGKKVNADGWCSAWAPRRG